MMLLTPPYSGGKKLRPKERQTKTLTKCFKASKRAPSAAAIEQVDLSLTAGLSAASSADTAASTPKHVKGFKGQATRLKDAAIE